MRTTNTECDMCGKTLRGRKGTAWIEEEHINLRGAMSVQTKDENGQPDHYFVTRNPQDDHHFCNWECLQGFADMRKKEYERARQNRLKAEANQQQDNDY